MSSCCCTQQGSTVYCAATGLPVPGQLNIPGGIASNGTNTVACGSGINAVYQDPGVNPNPTGGWMPLAQSIITAAQVSALQYEKGSIANATPVAQQARQIQQGSAGLVVTSKGITWNSPLSGTALLLIGVGVVVLFMVARK